MSTTEKNITLSQRRLEILLGHSIGDDQTSRRLAIARQEAERMRAGCSGGMMGFSPLARELVYGRRFGGAPRRPKRKPSDP